MKTYEQYKKLRELKAEIRNTKKRLVNDIMKRVKRYMWESGYSKGKLFDKNRQPLKIVVFPEKSYHINGFDTRNESLIGFTEESKIIIDEHAGGMITQSLINCRIETLINIWAWVERNDDKLKQAHTHYSKKEAA